MQVLMKTFLFTSAAVAFLAGDVFASTGSDIPTPTAAQIKEAKAIEKCVAKCSTLGPNVRCDPFNIGQCACESGWKLNPETKKCDIPYSKKQCDSDCAMLIDGGFCSDWDTLLCSKPASDVVLQGPKYNGVPTGTEEKDIRKCANFCKKADPNGRCFAFDDNHLKCGCKAGWTLNADATACTVPMTKEECDAGCTKNVKGAQCTKDFNLCMWPSSMVHL